VFGPKAKDNEDLRGLLNAGHRRGAVAGRCVVRGKVVETEELPAYCAVALAGLDDLPDTLQTRSVVVRMRRRAPGEVIEPWRYRINAPDGHKLGDLLRDWAGSTGPLLADVWPDMPTEVQDRDADVWEALLAVADLAGGEWPVRARVAAVTAVTDVRGRTQSLGVTLLRDLRAVFAAAGTDKLPTETILDRLTALDESPWADLRGKELDARGLARRLSKYDVRPRALRVGEHVFKGYAADDLADPWNRYLPSEDSVTSVTGLPADHPGADSNSVGNGVTDVTDARTLTFADALATTDAAYACCQLCGDLFAGPPDEPLCEPCRAELARSA